MFHQTNRPSLQSSHKILCILTVHLLLTHSCRGQTQLIGSSQPIVATVGDDIILPCQLQPAEDVAALALEWSRSDLDSIYVHVRRAGQEVITAKHQSYQGRTSVSIDGLKQGNISLKLSKVKLSDGGKYRCFILQLDTQSFVELVVASDAVSPPVISVTDIDRDRGVVVLQCGSKGWYPEPEVFWLDSEGNLLSAGPTETIRGPDDLYTVSSRVTVEKRLNNNFTCRVKQNKINQIRETHFIVPDDFFKAPPSSSPVIIGVAVSLVVFIVVIVAVFFFVWKWKQNKTKETIGGGNKKLSKSDDPEMHHLNPAGTSPVFVEVNPNGKYLHLTNKSKEDLKLKDWKLRVKLNDENPIMYIFEESIKLDAEKKVTIWAHGWGIHHPPSELRWMDLKCWTKGDKLLVELINCHEEIVTTTEIQEASQHNDTDPADQNSTEVFLEIDPNRKHLLLTNKSKEDLKLEGWKLRVKLNDQNPIMYTFKESIILRDKKSVTIWIQGWGRHSPPSELIWMDLKRWTKDDKLLVELINCDEDIITTTEGDKSPPGGNSNPESTSPLNENNGSSTSSQRGKSPPGGNSNAEPTSTPDKNDGSNTSSQSEEKPEKYDERKTSEEENKERPDVSQHVNTTPACKNSTEVFVKVGPNGNYLRLTTKSKEDLKLEGWKLRVKVNDQNPIMYIFEESIKFRAGWRVLIWASGCTPECPLSSDLTWKDLNRWAEGDKLLVELINCHEEIVTTTEV